MFKKIFCVCFCFLLFIAFPSHAAEQIRLGIMPFASRTSEISSSQASQVTSSITRNLNASPKISIIERERLRVIAREIGLDVNTTNQDSAMKIGELAGCQYILLGSITQLTQRYLSSKQSYQFLLDTYYGNTNENQESTATLEARVIDVATGRVVLSFSQSGSATISDVRKATIFSASGKYSKNELALRALEAASSRLGDKVREAIAGEFPMIISIAKNNIRINRGNTSGVNVGAFYKVYQDGEEIFDWNGKSLGKRSVNLALLRVVNVNSEFSTVEIINKDNQPNSKRAQPKKTGKATEAKKQKTSKSKKTENVVNITPALIREGDKIEAISFAEAEKLKIASQRIGDDK